MALGAERTNIFKLVLGQGMSLMAIGIAIGLIGAIAGPRVDVVALQRGRHRCRSCVDRRVFAFGGRADRLLRAGSPRRACRSHRRAAEPE